MRSPKIGEAKMAEAISRLPYFRTVEGQPLARTRIEGRELLNFASNNYLGLAADRRVTTAVQHAAATWGAGTAGSRLLNGNLALHVELETELCEFFRREAALVFASGYTANLGLLSSLTRQGDVILADEEIHASCHDGARLGGSRLRLFAHNDVEDLRERLVADRPMICLVEGVYSMSGDIAPLDAVGRAVERSSALLVADEAHAVGVLGRTGRGAAEQLDAEDSVDAIVMTLSKSLGACGGAVVGTSDLIEVLRYSARPFMFTASSTAPTVAGALAALRIIRRHPLYVQDVRERAAQLAAGLAECRVSHRYSGAAIVVVAVGSDFRTAQAWKMLWNRGVFCNASVSPAVPKGAGALRFSVMRTHTQRDVMRAARVLGEVLAELDAATGRPAP